MPAPSTELRTRALVLRTFDQGESDRLVYLYTEACGRVSAIAKGARRSRRRFPGALEILTLVDVRLVDPPRAQLMRLEGARLVRPFERIVQELGRYAIACQLLEILGRLTGEREASPELFRFACGVLEVLESERSDRLLALLVLTKTLARLGYRPQLAQCAGCGRAIEPRMRVAFDVAHGGAACSGCADPHAPRTRASLLLALEAGIRTPLRERGGLGLDVAAVREAESLLERFFRFHVGLDLRTTDVVRQLVPFVPSKDAGDPSPASPEPSVDASGARGDTRAAAAPLVQNLRKSADLA
jgi:DNA repair protein RecO (recombination protein O)